MVASILARLGGWGTRKATDRGNKTVGAKRDALQLRRVGAGDLWMAQESDSALPRLHFPNSLGTERSGRSPRSVRSQVRPVSSRPPS
jgi:hypothetical protein